MNNRVDNEGAIEQYLNGSMNSSEKKAFMNRLERDADLRRKVDTEVLIRKAIRNDQTTIPGQQAQSRLRFLAMLSTVAPEPGVAITAAQSAVTAAEKGSSMVTYLSGGGVVKGVIATVAGVAITVGATVIVPKMMAPSSDREQPAPNVRTESVQSLTPPTIENPSAEAPSQPAELQQSNAPAVQEKSDLPVESRNPEINAVRSTGLRNSGHTLSPGTNQTIRKATPETSNLRQEDAAGEADAAQQHRQHSLQTVTNDSVQVQFNIKMPKMKK